MAPLDGNIPTRKAVTVRGCYIGSIQEAVQIIVDGVECARRVVRAGGGANGKELAGSVCGCTICINVLNIVNIVCFCVIVAEYRVGHDDTGEASVFLDGVTDRAAEGSLPVRTGPARLNLRCYKQVEEIVQRAHGGVDRLERE